jgi:hypothetical protein
MAIATVLAVLTLLPSCADTPEPRRTVMNFLTSLREDTTSIEYLDQLLDFDELLDESSIYTYDSALSRTENKQEFAALLLKGGKVRDRWMKNQIIVGGVQISGDTAIVEVSFIDRKAKLVKQYYNKMGVHRSEDKWRIFAFKLF